MNGASGVTRSSAGDEHIHIYIIMYLGTISVVSLSLSVCVCVCVCIKSIEYLVRARQ